MAELAIVMVTYNSAEWLPRCLAAMSAALDGRSADIIVVDNASSDDSAGILERQAGVLVIRNAENLGFAAAVNQGVRVSTSPWVLLLNPDTIPRPGSLGSLLRFAETHAEYGIFGGRTLSEDGSVDPASCWDLPSLWSATCFAFGLNTLFQRSRLFDPESLGRWQRDSVREVGMVTGCLLLVQRSTWDALGGLDERFFVYGEDADFSARARELGVRSVITPDAQIVHAKGASSAHGRLPLLLAGKITYARRHFPGARAGYVVSMLRCGAAVRALGSRILRRETIWTAAWHRRDEWWDGFAHVG